MFLNYYLEFDEEYLLTKNLRILKLSKPKRVQAPSGRDKLTIDYTFYKLQSAKKKK